MLDGRDAEARRGSAVIRKEAWSFYRTSSGVRLCWELQEPKGPKGSYHVIRKEGFSAEQVPVSAYGGSSKNLKDLKKGEVFAYVGLPQNLKDLNGPRLRKGEVFAYVGSIQSLQDLKLKLKGPKGS